MRRTSLLILVVSILATVSRLAAGPPRPKRASLDEDLERLVGKWEKPLEKEAKGKAKRVLWLTFSKPKRMLRIWVVSEAGAVSSGCRFELKEKDGKRMIVQKADFEIIQLPATSYEIEGDKLTLGESKVKSTVFTERVDLKGVWRRMKEDKKP